MARALALLRIRSRFWYGREDRMRRHGMEAAGGLDIGWSDSFIVSAEIESSAADGAGQADHVQTLATYPPGYTFVTARLLDTVAFGRRWAGRGIAFFHNLRA